jgi:xylan 1,4-beta-xylosidase
MNSMTSINPILFGENPDPSILVIHDRYYMVTSSCENNCGLMRMWKSCDLVNWEPLYYVLNSGLIKSAWAPELIYFQGIYYIYNYTPGLGCWVTTSTDIEQGDWNEPIVLKGVQGIDPGHVVDEAGKRYLCMSSNYLYPLSDDGTTIIGDSRKIAEFWPIPDEIDVEGVFPEGPKFFKKDGYYYLITAQGGTVGPPTSHCVISYRSRHVLGPYELSPYNPILHTKSRKEKWWSKGHGTVFKGIDNQWYMVYHAIENAHRYAGRMTLIRRVNWDDKGWFYAVSEEESNISLEHDTIKKSIHNLLNYEKGQKELSALYNCSSLACYKKTFFLDQGVCIHSIQEDIGEKSMISFLPQHHHFDYEIALNNDTEVGFSLGFWFNKQLNCAVYIKNQEIGIIKHGQQRFLSDNIKVFSNSIKLKMRCDDGTVSFYHQLEADKHWYKHPYAFDIADWNPNVSEGFGHAKANFQVFGKGAVTISNIKYLPFEADNS